MSGELSTSTLNQRLRTKREFCKPVSKILLQKPVYIKQAHPFFISYCRHLFVRNDLAVLKDMLMHGSQIATIGTPGCARIWNSTADADLMLYLLWWSEEKKRNSRMHKMDSQGRLFSSLWEGYSQRSREASRTNVRSPWELQPIFITPWGEAAWGVTSAPFHGSPLGAWGKGAAPCLSLCIWISCGSPAHQFLSYQAKILCAHLCMVAVHPFMCLEIHMCVCIWICIYIPIFIYTSRIDILWLMVFLIWYFNTVFFTRFFESLCGF